jgi:alcohol dehydrogenase
VLEARSELGAGVKALVLDTDLSHKEVEVRRRQEDCLLRVRRAGICGTDLAIVSGDYKVRRPLILGHEMFGTVEEIDGGKRFRKGDRVVSEINVYCGVCNVCKAGMFSHCRKIETLGISRDGCFAEFLSVPAKLLHHLPDTVKDFEGPFVEPLAAALQLTKMSPIRPSDSVLVVGAGRLGLLVVQVLKLLGPRRIAVMGRGERKLRMAEQFGAKPFAKDDFSCLELTGGVGFDHVVEATGNKEGLKSALKLVRPRGTVHVKSTHGLPVKLDITAVVVRELRIQGSRCGPFDEAIQLLSSGRVNVSPLLTHTYRLEDYRDALVAARSPDSVKVHFEL